VNDRELLEMAAKAAGVDAQWRPNVAEGGEWLAVPEGDCWLEWNPLNLDDDALRLAVKLSMTIRLEDPAAVITGWAENQHVPFTADGNGPWFWKEWGRILDPAAATRRAIVRAAAAIGEAL
jgi:hypothetical protein